MPPRLYAFIDEAGQRASTARSSDHFVMSTVVVPEEQLPAAAAWLAQLRLDLGRRPGDTLHRKNLKTHSERLHAVKSLAGQSWCTVSSVVVCKRHLRSAGTLDDDQAYLYTFRFLLERLSWFARDHSRQLSYTLAHIVRFKLGTLREYEAALRAQPDGVCNVAWQALDAKGGAIDQPSRVELLQAADLAASSVLNAFEPDRYGNTERRYLAELLPVMYRRGTSATSLTSYGLKMHPWNDSTKAAYPWVAAL